MTRSLHTNPNSKVGHQIDRAGNAATNLLGILIVIAAFTLLVTSGGGDIKTEAPEKEPEIVWVDPEKKSAKNPMLDALVKAESNGDENALSSKGAAGKYQIMRATALKPGYGVTPLRWWDGKDPRTAPLHEQERFANELLNAFQAYHGGNPVLAAASYNAGVGNVVNAMRRAKGDIHKAIKLLKPETQNYVVSVAGYEPPQEVASLPPITYRYSPFDVIGGR